ncbi:hypothetical protein [Streptomyces albiaxialis]|uniref:hypothetical protein n=1 Tax=Streptomyces albiaxialis TaxID=329523 RepID=UPI003CD091AA
MSVGSRVRAVAVSGLAGAAGVAGLAGLLLTGAPPAAADTPDGFTIGDGRITESSGLAASRAHKGVYWTHNDSDDGPYVYAVDGSTGKTVATVTLRGIDPRDVEAVSVGPDGDVYVGDIGDNFNGRWPEVWIYRFHEPAKLKGDVSVTPTRYTVKYDDGPRDAESLMVHPKTGRVYITSKSDEGKGGIYAGPEKLTAGGVNTFRRIADTKVYATDGAFSPDGTRLMLRSYFSGEMFRWKDGAEPESVGTVPVPLQRQGESVTFTPDGRTLMFGSEGANSEVEPVELDGQRRPESVLRAERKGEDGKGGGASSGDGGDGKGTDRDDGKVVLGGVTFAVALGLWLGLRRLFRRGSR